MLKVLSLVLLTALMSTTDAVSVRAEGGRGKPSERALLAEGAPNAKALVQDSSSSSSDDVEEQTELFTYAQPDGQR